MGLKGLNSGLVQDVPSELRLGFVDLDFECATACPTLLGLMGILQEQLGKMVEHSKSKSIQPRSQLTWDTLHLGETEDSQRPRLL